MLTRFIIISCSSQYRVHYDGRKHHNFHVSEQNCSSNNSAIRINEPFRINDTPRRRSNAFRWISCFYYLSVQFADRQICILILHKIKCDPRIVWNECHLISITQLLYVCVRDARVEAIQTGKNGNIRLAAATMQTAVHHHAPTLRRAV